MDVSDPRIDPALVPNGSRAQVINGPNNEYHDLPAVVTRKGMVITRWTPTVEERARLATGEDIFVTLFSNGLINPMFVTAGPVDWTTC